MIIIKDEVLELKRCGVMSGRWSQDLSQNFLLFTVAFKKLIVSANGIT